MENLKYEPMEVFLEVFVLKEIIVVTARVDKVSDFQIVNLLLL